MENWIDELPFLEVAREWGLSVGTFNGREGSALGWFKHSGHDGIAIALGTKNLSTWLHELCHAAELKNGNLTKGTGQNKGNEIVAEFSGAVLAIFLGLDTEADLGGCFDYIRTYAGKGKEVDACYKLVDRICDCVATVLDCAEELKNRQLAA